MQPCVRIHLARESARDLFFIGHVGTISISIYLYVYSIIPVLLVYWYFVLTDIIRRTLVNNSFLAQATQNRHHDDSQNVPGLTANHVRQQESHGSFHYIGNDIELLIL